MGINSQLVLVDLLCMVLIFWWLFAIPAPEGETSLRRFRLPSLLTALSLVLSLHVWGRVHEVRAAFLQRCHITQGAVTGTEIVESDEGPSCAVKVHYVYEVDGERYAGASAIPRDEETEDRWLWLASRRAAQAYLLERAGPGPELGVWRVSVRYDPRRPERSTLFKASPDLAAQQTEESEVIIWMCILNSIPGLAFLVVLLCGLCGLIARAWRLVSGASNSSPA